MESEPQVVNVGAMKYRLLAKDKGIYDPCFFCDDRESASSRAREIISKSNSSGLAWYYNEDVKVQERQADASWKTLETYHR